MHAPAIFHLSISAEQHLKYQAIALKLLSLVNLLLFWEAATEQLESAFIFLVIKYVACWMNYRRGNKELSGFIMQGCFLSYTS